MLAKTAASGGPSLLPEMLAWTSSLEDDRALFLADVVGSLAHARMLGAQAIIPKDAAVAITRGLSRIARDYDAGVLTLPNEEDIHMSIERVLTERIGEPGKMLHAARSRNDQIALDLRLFLRENAIETIDAIATLIQALTTRASSSLHIYLPSYTHRQRAQPISLGFLLAGYAEMFVRDLDTFVFALAQVGASPLGAGASSGSSLPIDRDFVRKALAFDRVTGSAIDTVGDRDFALDFTYATSKLLLHVSRVATDIVDFSTSEFGFVKLGSGIACGSSMMPQKRNPDLFELLRGKFGSAFGSLASLFTTMKGLPFGYNRDQQEDRAPILTSAKLAVLAPQMLATGFANIEFDEARCLAALESDMTQATDLAEALVARGVPFRESHALVGSLVFLCKENGWSLSSLPASAAKNLDARFTDDVLASRDLAACVEKKKSAGGTASDRVRELLAAIDLRVKNARESTKKIPRLAALLTSLTDDGDRS